MKRIAAVKPGIFYEILEEVSEKDIVVRKEVEDPMWIIIVLDNGHVIRIQNHGEYVDVSSITGSLNVQPESGNVIRVNVRQIGSTPKETSHASL